MPPTLPDLSTADTDQAPAPDASPDVLVLDPCSILPSALTPDALRLLIAQIAEPLAGLTSRDPRLVGSYLEVLAGDDDEPTRRSMAAMSSCALTARAILRLAGATHDAIAGHYHSGRAVADVVEFGRAFGAWTLGNAARLPDVGDVIVIGMSGPEAYAWGGCEHVLTVVRIADGVLSTIEGGQGVKGEAISAKQRRIDIRGGTLWIHDADQPGGGRRAQGFVDVVRAQTAGGFPGHATIPIRTDTA